MKVIIMLIIAIIFSIPILSVFIFEPLIFNLYYKKNKDKSKKEKYLKGLRIIHGYTEKERPNDSVRHEPINKFTTNSTCIAGVLYIITILLW
jgi:uncharacterized protein YxeA